MKKILLSFLLSILLLCLAACEFSLPKHEKDPINDNPESPITYLTVTEAYDLAVSVGNSGTTEKQYVYGTIKNVTNSTYGEMYITDGTHDLYVYGVYSSDGALRYNELEEKPVAGDVVYLYGILKTYNNQPELGASWLQKFTPNPVTIDLTSYTNSTIIDARESEVGTKLIVEGVVAKITYASGMNPNGILLVDDSASIYIYGQDVAGRVRIGQKVKVAGVKTLYILESEQANALLYGYQGSIQLQDAIFISGSDDTYEFNKEWIDTTTIKNILDTPMSVNITTQIFKVTSIIKKVPGSGFVNYYINDLDNLTGSYCYTLCNGNDYAYLNAFDGKICEVYLTPINCKATSSGVIYRFVPVLVKEITDFQMNDNDIAEFALTYYVLKLFLSEYNSNPSLILQTSISNTYIPFNDVSITYESLNTDLINFQLEQDNIIMHIEEGQGKVDIIIKATYNDIEVIKTIEIFVNTKVIPEHISISDVLDFPDGTEVVLRGIVMSGIVNQTGFYLNDGTGVVAVTTDNETIKKISLGNEIIIRGIKNHKTTKPDIMVGQTVIETATLEINLFGNQTFDESLFITDYSFLEIVDLIDNVMVDQTTNVYITTCFITKTESSYSTNFYLASSLNGKDISLYAGSGSQYSIYNELVGQEVTIAFTLVNWNSKSPYKACIIYATNGETLIINNYNFR